MENRFSRTERLIGQDALNRLKNARVAVFGIGGVGGYAVEGLVRSGVGHIDIVDSDTVDITNLNRQIIATEKTVGTDKVDAAKERILSINSDIDIKCHKLFYSNENASLFDFKNYDYIVDAIDSVSSKIELIINAQNAGTPIISCMGTGNKLNASELEVSDIYKTSVCPLARVMRYELKKRGVKKLKVVYSKEPPINPDGERTPASVAFVPAAAGMIIAGEVIKDLIK